MCGVKNISHCNHTEIDLGYWIQCFKMPTVSCIYRCVTVKWKASKRMVIYCTGLFVLFVVLLLVPNTYIRLDRIRHKFSFLNKSESILRSQCLTCGEHNFRSRNIHSVSLHSGLFISPNITKAFQTGKRGSI